MDTTYLTLKGDMNNGRPREKESQVLPLDFKILSWGSFYTFNVLFISWNKKSPFSWTGFSCYLYWWKA
jgi:hypothetical protein